MASVYIELPLTSGGGSGITQLTGDVTAGPGSGSQVATLQITTTKGDIIVNDGSSNVRLPVGSDGQILSADSGEATGLKWMASGGTGTVTSVDMTVPSILTISGNPITTSGTLALDLATEAANKVFSGPTTGGAATPTFRSLVAADLPAGTGTVTSVAMTVPSILSVSGSPVTTSGTLAVTLATESANLVFAGPNTGGAATPTFRALVAADLPAGTGTVTSVALSAPAEFTVSGSPVTTTGTLTFTKANQNANIIYAGPSSGGAAAPAFRALVTADLPSNPKIRSFGCSLDGAGSAITTGIKAYFMVPYACTITGWTLLGDTTGSIVIDVWKDTYANYPPTIADTITGADKPTISSSNKGQNLSLSAWTTTVSAGDTFAFNVDSCTTITKATLIIQATVT